MSRRGVVAVFALALAVRLVTTAATQGLNAPPDAAASPDQVDYESITYHLASGQGYSIVANVPTAMRPPGTSLTLLPAYLTWGRSYVAARVWMCWLSALTCVAAAYLASLCGGARVGMLAGLWLSLYPGHFYYATHFLSEPIYGFWLAGAAVLTLIGLDTNRWSASLLAGLAWAMAILTRIELIILIPLIFAGAVLFRRRIAPRFAKHLAAQVMIALLVLSFWIGRNVSVFHTPVLSTLGGLAFWGAHNERTMTDPRLAGTWINPADLERDGAVLVGSAIERDRGAWKNGIASIQRHWHRLPFVVVMKIWRLLSPVFETDNMIALAAMGLGWSATAPFVLVGLWSVARAPDRKEAWRWLVPLAPLVCTLIMAALIYGLPRFRDGVSPLFVGLAALGFIRTFERLSRSRRS